MSEVEKKGPPKPIDLLQHTKVLLSHSSDGKLTEVPLAAAIKEDAVVCFYLSASWCPPCRSFTPELASVYQQLKADGKSIEVVFVSYDRDEDSFEAYFKKMPWLSLPRGSPCEKHLTSEWNVQGIPRLVVVGSDGRILNSNARQAVSKNGAAGFPWQQDSNEEESPASFTIYMILFAVLSWLAGYAWRNGYFDPILNSIGMGRS